MSKGIGNDFDLGVLSDLGPELAEMLTSFACDIAFVLDDGGVIQSVSVGDLHPAPDHAGGWIGQRWADTVTPDLRPKAELFLDDIANAGISRIRHVSHASHVGPEIPMAYSAVRLGQQGPTLAVGRDMRLVSAMQETLMQTQRELERQHWQRRQSDTRYRLLFQVSKEAMLIVDGTNYEVLDANRSANRLLGNAAGDMARQHIGMLFSAAASETVCSLLDSARGSTRVVSGEASRLADGMPIGISISPFSSETSTVLCLVLHDLTAVDEQTTGGLKARADERFAALFERSADAIAICDFDGTVVFVNDALLDLAQLPRSETMLGRKISEWIGSPDQKVADILELAKTSAPICLLRNNLRRRNGDALGVEIATTLLADYRCIGFIVRVCHAQDMTAEHARRTLGFN